MGLLDGIKAQQDEATQAASSIAAKTKMIDEYKAATAAPAPKPAPKAAPAAPRKPYGPDTTGKGYGSKPGEKRFKFGKDGEILGSYKKGGKVKKTGNYKLHKGERVLNVKQTKMASPMMKALGGMKDTDKDGA